jgi:hypothetical protein
MVKTEEHTSIQIVVHTLNIGVGVVVYHMLLLPEVGITAQEVKGVGHHIIHFGVAGIASMRSIVHDIKTYQCHAAAEKYAEQQSQPGIFRREEDKPGVKRDKHCENDDSFAQKSRIAIRRNVVRFEISVGFLFQGRHETGSLILKCNGCHLFFRATVLPPIEQI